MTARLMVAATVVSGFAGAQLMQTGASVTSDPLNALWSMLGSGTVAGVLYLWIRAEKADRQEERSERRQTSAEKDKLMTKMVELFDADGEHKAQIRERLKGQDEVLAKLLDAINRLDRTMSERLPRQRGEGGG